LIGIPVFYNGVLADIVTEELAKLKGSVH
jgi:hypothetical protein